MMKYSKTEIEDLVKGFSDGTLPKSEWTHEAHLVVAIWYNVNYDFQTAFELVKSKIKVYNQVVGTVNSDTSGYHETLTLFWMRITNNFLLTNRSVPIDEVTNRFLGCDLASKDCPLEYYSKTLLFSKKARKHWVNGDLKQIR